MVERLKDAISKARASRAQIVADSQMPGTKNGIGAGQLGPDGLGSAAAAPLSGPWDAIESFQPDPAVLYREHVVSYAKSDPAHLTFDLLRTRLLSVLRDNGWSRVAITSPTPNCGKTMVCANLAFSLARHPETRTVLLDMDLRAPSLAQCLGMKQARPIEWYLRGNTPAETYFLRVGGNLLLGANSERVRESAELVQSECTAKTLGAMNQTYQPDVVIYDLPPLLASDDVIAFMPNIDCVLLVAGGGQTRPAEIDECARILGEKANFLGVLLNKSEDRVSPECLYDYG